MSGAYGALTTSVGGKAPSISCSGVLQTTFVFFTEEDKGMGWGAESRGSILPLVEGVAEHAILAQLGGDFSDKGSIRDGVASIHCCLVALGEGDPEVFDGGGGIPGGLEAGHVGSHSFIIQLTIVDLDVVEDVLSSAAPSSSSA